MFLSGSTNLHCFAIVPLWSKWKHLLGFNLNTLLLGNSYHFLVLFFTFMFITVFKILPSRLFYLNSLFSLCLTLLLFIILSKDYDLCKYACPKYQKRIPCSPQCKTREENFLSSELDTWVSVKLAVKSSKSANCCSLYLLGSSSIPCASFTYNWKKMPNWLQHLFSEIRWLTISTFTYN